MKFNVLTLFPEMFAPMTMSILGRAVQKELLDFQFINIRDYSQDPRSRADDYSFGGGPGMVMMAQPIFGAMEAVDARNKRTIYMSPRGKVINQEILEELSREPELVILCGHYEGVDQRALDYWNVEELSVGDYIVTGGELPAMIMMDAIARLIPGVLASEEGAMEESVYSGLLEYPQYTRPRTYRDLDVPDILLSGDHRKIDLWRLEQSLLLTAAKRPELFEEFVKKRSGLAKDEQKVLEKVLSML